MVLYAIIAADVPGSRSARPAHLERLRALQEEGRMILAGPQPAIDSPDPGTAGFTGSLVVAKFPDLAAAEHWAGADLYVAAGVYAQVQVKLFIQTGVSCLD